MNGNGAIQYHSEYTVERFNPETKTVKLVGVDGMFMASRFELKPVINPLSAWAKIVQEVKYFNKEN
jgi:hypothetical protein